MILKIEAVFKAEQLIDLGDFVEKDIEKILVENNSIEVFIKDHDETLQYPFEIPKEPTKATYEIIKKRKKAQVVDQPIDIDDIDDVDSFD